MNKENIIISFNGDEGSGKSTIAKIIASKLQIPRFYMGQIFRDKAKEKNLTLADFLLELEETPEKEKEIDKYIIELAEKEEPFIIESRVAFALLPQSLKIYLKVDPKEAARRILNQSKERNEDKNFDSIESIKRSILERKAKDGKRYANLYGVNIRDEKNYDFILDTTNLNINEVCQKILDFINEELNQKNPKHGVSK